MTTSILTYNELRKQEIARDLEELRAEGVTIHPNATPALLAAMEEAGFVVDLMTGELESQEQRIAPTEKAKQLFTQ